ncbi:MAG: DUF1573 domain-containing protein [Bacteroidia bacterium]
MIISNANASCGCTVPNFSKEPVAPGAQMLFCHSNIDSLV